VPMSGLNYVPRKRRVDDSAGSAGCSRYGASIKTMQSRSLECQKGYGEKRGLNVPSSMSWPHDFWRAAILYTP
jgi:hypothetical protein